MTLHLESLLVGVVASGWVYYLVHQQKAFRTRLTYEALPSQRKHRKHRKRKKKRRPFWN